MKKYKVGVVGLGYWGPNLIRNFSQHEGFEMVWGCDLIDANLNKIKKEFNQIKLTKDFNVLLNSDLDLIVVATPPESHFFLGQKVLERKKHLWTEKPFTTSLNDANKLVRLAKKVNRYVHVDLPFIFYGPVQKIKDLIVKREIGRPFYYDSIRTNLGLIQKKIDVVWDLAPHDISILFYLFPDLEAEKILISGSHHLGNTGHNEIADLIIHFNNSFSAYIHLSWLSPMKQRLITIVGAKKMILFDDINPTEKIKVYDKGVSMESADITAFKPVYRSGDVWIPTFERTEALSKEIDFLYKELTGHSSDYFTAKIALKILAVLSNAKLENS